MRRRSQETRRQRAWRRGTKEEVRSFAGGKLVQGVLSSGEAGLVRDVNGASVQIKTA